MIRVELLSAAQLAAHQDQLAEFERAFTYPLEGELTFRIDHGINYAAFFEGIGNPVFSVLFDGDLIVGILVGMQKTIRIRGRDLRAVYYGDLKIRPDYQKRGLTKRLYRALIGRWLRTPSTYFACHYGIAMQKGENNTFVNLRRRWFFRRFGELSLQLVFFATPKQLAQIAPSPNLDERALMKRALDLAPRVSGLVVSTRGKKDLWLDKASAPMNFTHFAGHQLFADSYLSSLKKAGEQADGHYDQICFALDSRRTALINHLKANAINPTGSATVYALPSPVSLLKPTCVCVSTSEI